jgi:putative transposase
MIVQLLVARFATRIHRLQDQVIAYLLEENRILKAKLAGQRLTLTDTERRRLAVLAHAIDRKRLKDIATIATPDTLQRWYRRLVVREDDRPTPGKQPGRPRVAPEIEQLVVRMAQENATWGYRRIQGALANLGQHIDKITVRNILRRHHIDPAPIRRQAGMSWTQFLQIHWDVLAATGFFTVDVATLADLRAPVLALGRDFATWCIHLAVLIHHGILEVIIPWSQPLPSLWARCLASA